MGVLDIYGFEIFEVRKMADQTFLSVSRTETEHPIHFISFKKDFAPGVCVLAYL